MALTDLAQRPVSAVAGIARPDVFFDMLRERGVRIAAGTTAANDLEPEYISVSPDGKTAWVTGAGTGIGRAIALGAAAAGAEVVALGRDRRRLEALEASGAGRVWRVPADA